VQRARGASTSLRGGPRAACKGLCGAARRPRTVAAAEHRPPYTPACAPSGPAAGWIATEFR
jgi:hypothetical protein